jgi:cell division protein FtsI/penicillin-binding protein 2
MESLFRTRAALVSLGVAVFSSALCARLFQLQVLDADRYRALARRQHEHLVEVFGRRGAIVDRNGRELAASVATFSLFAHPWKVPDPARVARLLAPVLEMPEGKLLEKLRSDSPFVWLRRRLDPKAAKAVSALGLPVGPGMPLGFESEGKRFYPQGELAAQVVGVVGELRDRSAAEASGLSATLPGHSPWGAQADAARARVSFARGGDNSHCLAPA